jgi:hypothetical protein
MTGCGTPVKIPDINVYKEIPFIDAPEGVYHTTTSQKSGIIGHEGWMQIRPVLVCVDSHGWTQIKKSWLEACRYAGKKCNEVPESISELIKKLDDFARQVAPHVINQ